MLLAAICVASVCIFLITSCENNVYLGTAIPVEHGLWKVGESCFDTFRDAMDHVCNGSAERAIILQRHVHEGERGGGILIPPEFSGRLTIDFNGFTYEFDDSTSHFFLVMGDAEVFITGGTSVIYNEASHIPLALDVRAGSAELVSHTIDDRRRATHGKYGFGIGEIIVPALPAAPDGDLRISQDGNVFTVWFIPYPNSSAVQAACCRFFLNGRWSSFLPQAEDGSFTFVTTRNGQYKIVMHVSNSGGTISLEEIIYYLP